VRTTGFTGLGGFRSPKPCFRPQIGRPFLLRRADAVFHRPLRIVVFVTRKLQETQPRKDEDAKNGFFFVFSRLLGCI
jgi:hypothetical protein